MTLVEIAEQFLRAVTADLDKYTTKEGKITTNSTGATLLTPSHIQFAKYGRGPGKPPPLDPILEWVTKKGIIFEGLDAKGTANAIVWGISKNGTKNWVANAPNAMEEAIAANYKQYNEKLLDTFTINISSEIAKLEVLPKKITMKI